MAKIRSGILSQTRGKVAGVVGAVWKGKNYIREYVKPAYTNTDAQIAQRTSFGLLVAFAKQILGPVINIYVDPFVRDMSGYNYFIKQNLKTFKTNGNELNFVSLTSGKLSPPVISGLESLGSGMGIRVSYTDDLGANGKADDEIVAVAYNILTKKVDQVKLGVRNDGKIDLDGCDEGVDYYVWVFAAQRNLDDKLMMVSASAVDTYSV